MWCQSPRRWCQRPPETPAREGCRRTRPPVSSRSPTTILPRAPVDARDAGRASDAARERGVLAQKRGGVPVDGLPPGEHGLAGDHHERDLVAVVVADELPLEVP